MATAPILAPALAPPISSPISSPPAIARGEHVPTADRRMVLHRVSWAQFEAQLSIRGESASPRVAYLDGEMELMSPSKDHERLRSYIGRLVETYAQHIEVDLSPYGSWTLKSAPKQAGVEPDECYLIGPDQDRATPDLVIEVVWTSGGIDKLEAYRRLGVPEVWFWQGGKLELYLLSSDRYEASTASLGLPGLDLALLASFLGHPTALQAIRAYRAALTQR
jgi:Uma2 family endonuclease